MSVNNKQLSMTHKNSSYQKMEYYAALIHLASDFHRFFDDKVEGVRASN